MRFTILPTITSIFCLSDAASAHALNACPMLRIRIFCTHRFRMTLLCVSVSTQPDQELNTFDASPFFMWASTRVIICRCCLRTSIAAFHSSQAPAIHRLPMRSRHRLITSRLRL